MENIDQFIRVLVLDGEATHRRILSNIVNSSPAAELVGVAANASFAVKKLMEAPAELILIGGDKVDGDIAETLREIRETYHDTAIILCEKTEGLDDARRARSSRLGVLDLLPKPKGKADIQGIHIVHEELQRHLRQLKIRLLVKPNENRSQVPQVKSPSPQATASNISLKPPASRASQSQTLPKSVATTQSYFDQKER